MDSQAAAILITFGLIAAGTVLLGFELFVLPGFGLAGIGGLLMLAAATGYAWIALGQTVGLLVCGLSLFGAVALAVFALRSTAAKKRLVLETSLTSGGGTQSAELTHLIGARGVTKTALRPAGVAVVGGARIDVVSDGGFIEKDTPIVITLVEGPRIVVQRVATADLDDNQGGIS